jgi:hypothetical protein
LGLGDEWKSARRGLWTFGWDEEAGRFVGLVEIAAVVFRVQTDLLCGDFDA